MLRRPHSHQCMSSTRYPEWAVLIEKIKPVATTGLGVGVLVDGLIAVVISYFLLKEGRTAVVSWVRRPQSSCGGATYLAVQHPQYCQHSCEIHNKYWRHPDVSLLSLFLANFIGNISRLGAVLEVIGVSIMKMFALTYLILTNHNSACTLVT